MAGANGSSKATSSDSSTGSLAHDPDADPETNLRALIAEPPKKDPLRAKPVDRLVIEDYAPGTVTRLRVWIVADGMGDRIRVPVVVVRGVKPGPVVGVTAAIHGNELNGIRVIHKLLAEVDPAHLLGTLVVVPVINIPGYLLNRREYADGSDLNRLMPGKETGKGADVFAARFMDRVVTPFEYLIDLHTASFGRANSLYVRADLSNPTTAWMARLQHPQIILHNCGEDGTLRSAAVARGAHAITVEVGDPQRFQQDMIRRSTSGVLNVLGHLEMLPLREQLSATGPVTCLRSSWMYTEIGGVLEVFPKVATRVKKGELVARVSDVFGDTLREYHAPEDAIVIGKSTNPVAPTGSRILHLGVEGDPSEALPPCPVPRRNGGGGN